MINVSKEFKETMKLRTDFKEKATVTLANGTVLKLTEKDFTVSNNKLVDGSCESKIPLGAAICRNIQIEIMNDRGQFSAYDFFGAVIDLYLTFSLSESIEEIPFGRFTVNTPGTYGETIIITAVDDMWKTDSAYSTSLTYPATVGEVLQEICDNCDLLLSSADLKNSDFIVNEPLSSEYTYRAAIGYIAMIAAGNARINRFGKLEIMSYDFTILDALNIYNGGTFNPWDQTISVDGGTFNPWNIGDVADGGSFGDREGFHVLYQWKNISVGTDDVVITGIKVAFRDEDGKDISIMEGSEGYVLGVTNPLATGRESELASLLGNAMIGASFRKFEGDHIAYPLAEFMDPALVIDRKQNVYRTYITDIDFTFLGMTTLKNCAEDSLRNGSQYTNDSVKAYVDARKLVVRERTDRQKAVANLAKQLSESSGLFMTAEVQADKSTIYYMHDKPTLKESMVIWKLTANAFGISTDGGKTYPYGLDVSGTAILNMIYAIGINADYVKSGTMTADRIRGGEFSLGGKDNKNGILYVYDNDGNLVGYWKNTGIRVNSSDGADACVIRDGFIQFYLNEQIYSVMGVDDLKIGDNPLKAFAFRNTESSDVIVFTDGSTAYYIINPRNKTITRSGHTENHYFNGSARITDGLVTNKVAFTNQSPEMYGTTYDGGKAIAVDGGLYAYGSMGCSGTKYRVVDTEHYGKRGMNAFETAEAYFADIGSGEIGENGICRIRFDPMFAETVESDKEYRVQITQTSAKKTEWVEKHEQYFVVHGEPGATFDWMLMCKQKGYADARMREIALPEIETVGEQERERED